MSDGRQELPLAAAAGMSRRVARRLEYGIIALGIFALALIFQPFSLTLFGVGCGLVVFAGLINNLLPMCQSGVSIRAVVQAGLIVALIFCIVMLLSIVAAHLYGVFFVIALAPDASEPFYLMPFVWGVAATAAILGAIIAIVVRTGPAGRRAGRKQVARAD
jgi:hypothetical protein